MANNYEEMSDFEINCEVAMHRFDVFVFCHDGNFENCVVRTRGVEFDSCNNPSDAWPIITEHGISLNKFCKTDSSWTADVEHPNPTDYYNTIEVAHKEPLRAAMICFLKMKDAEVSE